MTTSTLKEYENEILIYKEDIKHVSQMSQSEMQEEYGTDDTKQEFLEMLHEELSLMEEKVAEYYAEDEPYEYEVDPAFASEEDCLRQFI